MRFTSDHAKVGKTFYTATITTEFPLADPSASGNFGLEGFDEDHTRSDEFDTREAAQRWVARQVPAEGGRFASAYIIEFTYDEAEFEDDEFGTVFDADYREVTQQDGYPDEDTGECQGHVDTNEALTSGVGIGEAVYCDGTCNPLRWEWEERYER